MRMMATLKFEKDAYVEPHQRIAINTITPKNFRRSISCASRSLTASKGKRCEHWQLAARLAGNVASTKKLRRPCDQQAASIPHRQRPGESPHSRADGARGARGSGRGIKRTPVPAHLMLGQIRSRTMPHKAAALAARQQHVPEPACAQPGPRRPGIRGQSSSL
jgi:hypothetical protein